MARRLPIALVLAVAALGAAVLAYRDSHERLRSSELAGMRALAQTTAAAPILRTAPSSAITCISRPINRCACSSGLAIVAEHKMNCGCAP